MESKVPGLDKRMSGRSVFYLLHETLASADNPNKNLMDIVREAHSALQNSSEYNINVSDILGFTSDFASDVTAEKYVTANKEAFREICSQERLKKKFISIPPGTEYIESDFENMLFKICMSLGINIVEIPPGDEAVTSDQLEETAAIRDLIRAEMSEISKKTTSEVLSAYSMIYEDNVSASAILTSGQNACKRVLPHSPSQDHHICVPKTTHDLGTTPLTHGGSLPQLVDE
jgi:hypothetical protein